jgi:FKBP-type peptidyl-prolyl cis-trans isomerase SlyD
MARKATQKTSETPEAMIIGDDCVVAFHYKLCEILADGSKSGWLEESTGRQPLLYLHGHSNVISGLEQAMSGKKAGDTLEITLAPEQAYGPRRSNSLLRVPIKHLHLPAGNKSLVPGTVVGVQTDRGVRSALVVKAGRFNVDIDTNHPFAGRTLHYQLEIVSVRAATPEEITHRHAHGEGGHHH